MVVISFKCKTVLYNNCHHFYTSFIYFFNRAAEIIFSYAYATARKEELSHFQADELVHMLSVSRKSLGLFQHHDAITGTAKDHVVIDYGKK